MRSMVNGALGPMGVNDVDNRLSPTVNSVDREADWLALVGRAAGKAGLSHKAMHLTLEVDKAQLSRQLSGAPNHHLSYRRMWRLSREFWQELVLLIVEFYDLQIGVSAQDRADMELGRTIRESLERRLAR